MSEKTITFSPVAKGWTSFHSYFPQWMLGMNSLYYTFYEGKPWKHYSNPTRNSYYGAATVPSIVQFVINDAPIETKMFKTLELEGTQAWQASLISDLHLGSIEKEYFVPKEGVFYANIRRTVETGTDVDLSQISTQGIGNNTNVIVLSPTLLRIEFTLPAGQVINPLVNSWAVVPVVPGDTGDVAYYQTGPTTFAEIGPIVAIDRTASPQFIEIEPWAATPLIGDFIFAVKNSVAESYGLRGHYADITLTNDSSDLAELFAASSETFKSYP